MDYSNEWDYTTKPVRQPETCTVLVSPELVKILKEDWSRTVQVKILTIRDGRMVLVFQEHKCDTAATKPEK
jgi:hypothetical protein